MAAIPISGKNGEALVGATTDVRHILETNTGGAPDFDGDGRVFELTNIRIHNSHGGSQALILLYDDDEGSGPAGSGNTRVGGAIPVPPNSTVAMTWKRGTGPTFRTNIVAETLAAFVPSNGRGEPDQAAPAAAARNFC